MIAKYFSWATAFIATILLFSSCLNSSNGNIEYPTDPQIYAISISSRTDTTSQLPGVAFTIDQVNGEIFNKQPLPYLFRVDSAVLNLSSSNNYFPFTQVELTLEQDCTYVWRGDSIAINRLRKIKTTAADGITTKNYKFQLNTYREDPYIITWTKVNDNYLTAPVADQKTVAHKGRFLTYYLSGTEMKAVASSGGAVSLSGMPYTIALSSLIVSGDTVYALDAASGFVYRSSDGAVWTSVPTSYKVVALYGKLPFASSGDILLGVFHDGKHTFARAGSDLSVITLMNDIPADMPITDFSAMTMESNSSFASKFIFLSGGTKADKTTPNNDVWVLQADEGVIKYIASRKPEGTSLKGSSLFFYDDKPYMLITSAGKNLLMYSENYGVDWIEAGENHAFPTGFTGRTNASVITDANNYIWIFGGISSSGNTQLADVWKGRFNKFALN